MCELLCGKDLIGAEIINVQENENYSDEMGIILVKLKTGETAEIYIAGQLRDEYFRVVKIE